MCELCVDVAQLNNFPYTLPLVVSLHPDSDREPDIQNVDK